MYYYNNKIFHIKCKFEFNKIIIIIKDYIRNECIKYIINDILKLLRNGILVKY